MEDKNNELNNQKDQNKMIQVALGKFFQMGVHMVMCIVLSFIFGRYLDKIFATTPLFIIIFLILGIASSYKVLFDYTKTDRGKRK